MRGTLTGFISRRQQSRDDGFSLIELIIALFIIGGVLLSLVALQTRAMVSIAQAKERQQATAIANEVLEQLRALPWQTITKGPAKGAYSGAPYVSGDKLTIPGEPITNETLQERAPGDHIDSDDAAGGSPLDGIGGSNRTIHTDPALPGFEFQAYSYVTQAGEAGGPYNLTVLVEWEARGKGEERRVIARTSAFNTGTGCGAGSETRPYATACQNFFLANSHASAPSITVEGQFPSQEGDPGAGDPGPYEILPGAGITEIRTSGASIGVTIDSAQSSLVRGSASNGSITLTELDGSESSTAGEDALVVASDSVTATDPPDSSASTTGPNLPITHISGSGMELVVDPGTRTGGVTANTNVACSSWAISKQPCSFGNASNAKQTVRLKVGGETINLLEISAVSLESQAARFPGGSGSASNDLYCSIVTGSGCTGAKATSGPFSATFKGIAQLTGHSLVSGGGRGDSLIAGNAINGRSGSLYIERIGNINVSPATDETYSVNDPDDPLIVFDNGSVLVTAEADFEVASLAVTENGSDPECRLAACAVEAKTSPLVAKIKYFVTDGSHDAAFSLTVPLGELNTTASFTAAPEAWEDE